MDRTKYMSVAEVQVLRDVAKQRKGKIWMLVDFALNTGLRVSEIALVRVEDIDLKRSFIRVQRLKKKRLVIDELAIDPNGFTQHLREYIGSRKSGPLFIGERGPLTAQGLQRIWKKAVKDACLPKEYTIHCARHTHAVGLLRKSKNLRLVQKRLGHSSPATTANMYADVPFEDMQDAVTDLY